MNATKVNGSVDNAALLNEIQHVRTEVTDINTRLGRIEGTCKTHCAGVNGKVRDIDDRLKLIERRWLPVLTSIRAKLIFIPTAFLFVLASISYVIKIAAWVVAQIGP